LASTTSLGRFCRRAALLAAIGALALAVLLPSAASAAQAHAFSLAFGSPGSGAGQLALQPSNAELSLAGSGLAVSAQTADLYVADSNNHRIDVFEASGAFLRAFGWEVNASSPEAKLQSCTALSGCRAGSSGTEPGQLANPTFLALDNDPTSPSYGDLYAATGAGVEGSDESQGLTVVGATGGTFTLTFEGETTAPILYNASRRELELALGRLATIGFGNVFVFSDLPKTNILFRRRLEDTNVPQLIANSAGLQGAGAEAQVTTVSEGVPSAPEIITKYDPEGNLIGGWGASGQLAGTPALAVGTGTLSSGSAIGTGDVAQGSTTITNVNTESGEFKAGQGIDSEEEETD
jgi:hypothetical protein